MIQLIQNLFFSKTVTFQQTKKTIVNTLEGRTSNPEPFGGHLPNQAQDSSFTFIILSLMPHSGFFLFGSMILRRGRKSAALHYFPSFGSVRLKNAPVTVRGEKRRSNLSQHWG